MFRLLRFNHFSVIKRPNWLFLHQCLISRIYLVAILLFDYVLRQKWDQKLTKPEIFCANLWSFLCFWRKFLVGWVHQHPFSKICENWIISYFLAMTVPVLIIFKNYFLLIFDHLLLAMLLLIFKFLFGVVAWKCQIVKLWYFLEEHNTVTIF